MTLRPAKLENEERLIREKARQGEYRFSNHCLEQMDKRGIRRYEVDQIIEKGWREKRKDSYDDTFSQWNYAMRGHTIGNEKELRIIVSFDAEIRMLVITAIDLGLVD